MSESKVYESVLSSFGGKEGHDAFLKDTSLSEESVKLLMEQVKSEQSSQLRRELQLMEARMNPEKVLERRIKELKNAYTNGVKATEDVVKAAVESGVPAAQVRMMASQVGRSFGGLASFAAEVAAPSGAVATAYTATGTVGNSRGAGAGAAPRARRRRAAPKKAAAPKRKRATKRKPKN